MALTLFDKDLNIISALADEPNDVGGLGPDEFKAKFDEAGNIIKNYINKSLIPELESDIDAAAQGVGSGGGIDGSKILVNSMDGSKVKDGTLATAKYADGSLTTPKYAKGSVTREILAEDARTVLAEDLPNKVVPNRALDDNAVTTVKIENAAVTYSKLSKDAVRIRAKEITVATTAFVADTTYEDFPYRAAIAIDGATADMKPDVTFDYEQIATGIYAPVAESFDGGVYIYASEVPAADITIPVIDLWR